MLVVIGRNWRRLLVAALLAVAAVNAAELAIFGAARAVIATVSGRLVPIYFVATGQGKIAFTFEGGPGRDNAQQILRILRDHGVKATFFLSGAWIAERPADTRALAQEGHEVGNHTYSTPHVNSLSAAEIRQELEKAHKLIVETCGQSPSVFRPPYGEYSNKVIEAARELGYETVVWSLDSLDWRGAPADDIKARVLAKVHKGSIVRFHIGAAHTAEALPGIISELKKLGYSIVPLSDLLVERSYYIHPHTGEQRPIELPRSWRPQEGGAPNDT